MQSVEIAANRLTASLVPLPELRIAFGLLSRFYLEAYGYVQYHTHYLPRVASTTRPTVDLNG